MNDVSYLPWIYSAEALVNIMRKMLACTGNKCFKSVSNGGQRLNYTCCQDSKKCEIGVVNNIDLFILPVTLHDSVKLKFQASRY